MTARLAYRTTLAAPGPRGASPRRPRRSGAVAVGLLAVALAGCATTEPAPAAQPPRPRPIVALLTDFGAKDDAVALLRGTVLSIARDATLVDVTHEVPPFDIEAGARALEDSPGIFPAGTVFVVVVDPGVGTARAPIAVELANGCFLVGPDNGVLSLAMAKHKVAAVRSITDPRFMRSSVSTTFHGRDVFAPAGAQLALGHLAFAAIGPEVAGWVKLPARKVELLVRAAPGTGEAVEGLGGSVVALDEPYGNVWTDIDPRDLARIDAPGDWRGSGSTSGLDVKPAASPPVVGTNLVFELGEPRRKVTAPLVATFGDVAEGKPLAYWSSRGKLALAINMGDAARTFGVKRGSAVTVSRAP